MTRHVRRIQRDPTSDAIGRVYPKSPGFAREEDVCEMQKDRAFRIYTTWCIFDCAQRDLNLFEAPFGFQMPG